MIKHKSISINICFFIFVDTLFQDKNIIVNFVMKLFLHNLGYFDIFKT